MGILKEDSEDSKKESTLFGSGFLERAAKRLEDEKAIVKVTWDAVTAEMPAGP